MKKIIYCLVLLFSVCTIFAEDEKISMIVGTTKSIRVPFVVESYKLVPAKSDIVKVETSESYIRVMASKVGEVNLTVSGGGMSNNYTITVKSNLAQTLRKLRNDLDALTELDIATNEDQIVIHGTVTNPEHWTLLMKVLPNYSGKCVNFATFKPSAETLLNLKKMLQDAGFVFAEEGTKPGLGQISMNITPDAVVISGELCSQQQVAQINQILGTQTWLAVGETAPNEAAGRVRGIVNLNVIETPLQVDIVYVGVTDSDAERIGSKAPTANFNMNWLFDLIHGRKDENSSITFGSNMQQTLGFLAQNGITRTYEAGHVTFLNHDEKGGKLHTGGTVSVKVSGMNSGALQDIDYGLTITVKGGLVDANKVKLDLSIENTSLVTTTGDAYTRAVDSTQQTIHCGLNKTVVLAGSRKISQSAEKSGLPVLRNTPVLKWFVSEDGKNKSETRLLILACPRLASADNTVEIEIPVSQETAPTYKEAKGDLKEDIKKKDEEKAWYKRWFGK